MPLPFPPYKQAEFPQQDPLCNPQAAAGAASLVATGAGSLGAHRHTRKEAKPTNQGEFKQQDGRKALAASRPRLLQQVGRGAYVSEQPQPSPGVWICSILAPLPHRCPRPCCFPAIPSCIWHAPPPRPAVGQGLRVHSHFHDCLSQWLGARNLTTPCWRYRAPFPQSSQLPQHSCGLRQKPRTDPGKPAPNRDGCCSPVKEG